MDDLVRELNQLRVNRDEAAREYHRTMQESSTRERTLLVGFNARVVVKNNSTTTFVRIEPISLSKVISSELPTTTMLQKQTVSVVSLTSPDAWLISGVLKPTSTASVHGRT